MFGAFRPALRPPTGSCPPIVTRLGAPVVRSRYCSFELLFVSPGRRSRGERCPRQRPPLLGQEFARPRVSSASVATLQRRPAVRSGKRQVSTGKRKLARNRVPKCEALCNAHLKMIKVLAVIMQRFDGYAAF